MVSLNGSVGARSMALPLVRVRPGQSVRLTLAGSALLSLSTHWTGKGSLVCCGFGGYCPGCAYSPARAVTYALAYDDREEGRRTVLIEAPGVALHDLYDRLPNDGAGCIVEVSRSAIKRPLRFKVVGTSTVPSLGPDSWYRVLAALSVLYGMPVPTPGEAIATWFARTKDGLERKLVAAFGD